MVERSTKGTPVFSIITPSYNMLQFLPLCSNSVFDQGVDYEHIVIDGGSTDGTVEWLNKHPDLISKIEEDHGMYDAVNKGIRMSSGEVVSYLNCDEQYLPNALQRVAETFHRNPRLDILFGNALIIRPTGELLAYRKSFVPRWPYVWASHMYTHSSSMFVRRKVFESGILFDPDLKAIGDAEFVVRVLRSGFVARHIREYLSAYMITGSNLGHNENALVELIAFRKRAPMWLHYSKFVMHNLIRLEKALHGTYWEKMPLCYSVFTTDNVELRTGFAANSASSLYPHKA